MDPETFLVCRKKVEIQQIQKTRQLLDLELCGRKNILTEANTVHFLILLIHQIFFKLGTMLDAGDTLYKWRMMAACLKELAV